MNHLTQAFRLTFSLLTLTLSEGCSWDTVQRTGYETVESMRQQHCLDKPDADCPAGRIRYDDYQSERQQLKQEGH